ncbi:hypothetical protein G6F24_016970 [Rhizopus arrhizus]|nr:hypothetical protein G6F24_016970 [Rhizopus arrhizus]
MRKDPPVAAEYIYDTQVLDVAAAAGACVVNNPQGLRDYNEKLAALLFPHVRAGTRPGRAEAAGRHGRHGRIPPAAQGSQPERHPGNADRQRRAHHHGPALHPRHR